ncbi:hypothetical protein G6O67_005108 [Ophiocordyceps sinensis]|uniref:Uncharacterized protein n=1 Tax=Ophiocordyceps sinensis TaxID=72228 RepID=A0A8H4PQS7_9HYPO|nr:hypothetical protein G6O67_005108 [Ophiocordyceps sinensis]
MIRQLVRRAVPVPVARVRRVAQVHLEANRPALVMLYAVPPLWSVAAHIGLLHHLLFAADDRSPTTRAALAFVQADFTAIGITVLYWIAAEAGWRILLLSLVVGCLVGPGAGLCVAWVVRERDMASVLGAQGTCTHHDKDR